MPNTIAENLTRLQNARTAIATAITNKGGTVPTGAGFEDFPTAINTIAGNTATITSTSPISFRSNGQPWVDWEIEGSSGGVGERTKNLINYIGYNQIYYGVRWFEDDGVFRAVGTYNSSSVHSWPRLYIQLPAGSYIVSGSPDYTITRISLWIGTCDDDSGTNFSKIGEDTGNGFSFTLTSKTWISTRMYTSSSLYLTDIDVTLPLMLREADTTPDFIPYGYEIPVTCGGTTTDIFIGDTPLGEGETISKSDTNIDIPTRNGNNTLTVNTTAQPSNVSIEYYNYTAGIPYNTDGLCLYYADDIGRVRIPDQSDHEPDVSKLNSAPYSLTGFDDTTIEVRFTMPENFTDKARLIELGDHNGVILAINLNENVPEVSVNGTWAESFSTTFTGGETYTLSVTIGSGDIKLYVNGVYAEADTYTTFSAAGPIVTFCNGGAIGMDTRWFPSTSDISKIRVYDRVLSAAEITSNYQIDNPT